MLKEGTSEASKLHQFGFTSQNRKQFLARFLDKNQQPKENNLS